MRGSGVNAQGYGRGPVGRVVNQRARVAGPQGERTGLQEGAWWRAGCVRVGRPGRMVTRTGFL